MKQLFSILLQVTITATAYAEKNAKAGFNGSKLTPNQAAAQSNVTPYDGLIIDRTTSQGLGNSAKAATGGTGAGIDAQRNKKP